MTKYRQCNYYESCSANMLWYKKMLKGELVLGEIVNKEDKLTGYLQTKMH